MLLIIYRYAYRLLTKRRHDETMPANDSTPPKNKAEDAPSAPNIEKNNATQVAPRVCPTKRAIAIIPLALPVRCWGAEVRII